MDDSYNMETMLIYLREDVRRKPLYVQSWVDCEESICLMVLIADPERRCKHRLVA